MFDASRQSGISLLNILQAIHNRPIKEKDAVIFLVDMLKGEYSPDIFNPYSKDYERDCIKLQEFLNGYIGTSKMLDAMSINVLHVLSKMTQRGIHVDGVKLREILDKYLYTQNALYTNICEVFQQNGILADFHNLLECAEGSGNQYLIQKVQEYMKNEKRIRLVKGFYELCMKSADSYVHPTFNMFGSVTGRITTINPNFQGLPKVVREECVRPVKERCYIRADFKAEEIVLLLILAGDFKMLEEVIKGKDFHRETASKLFHVPLMEVTEEQRKFGKEINFSFLYGSGKRAIGERISQIQNAEEISVDELWEYLQRSFPWISQLRNQIERQGYIETLFGSKIPLKEVEQYKRVNYLIQRSASELLKHILVELEKALPEDSEVVCCIHDEIMVETMESNGDMVLAMVKDIMETTILKSNFINNQAVRMPVSISFKKGDNHMASLNQIVDDRALRKCVNDIEKNKKSGKKTPIVKSIREGVQYCAVLKGFEEKEKMYELTFVFCTDGRELCKSFQVYKNSYDVDELLYTLVRDCDDCYEDAIGRVYLISYSRSANSNFKNLQIYKEVVLEEEHPVKRKPKTSIRTLIEKADEEVDFDGEEEYDEEFEDYEDETEDETEDEEDE